MIVSRETIIITVVGILPSASLGRAGMTPHSHKGYSPFLLSGEGGIIVQDFVTIIQSVGFPIAVAVAMFIMLQRSFLVIVGTSRKMLVPTLCCL